MPKTHESTVNNLCIRIGQLIKNCAETVFKSEFIRILKNLVGSFAHFIQVLYPGLMPSVFTGNNPSKINVLHIIHKTNNNYILK